MTTTLLAPQTTALGGGISGGRPLPGWSSKLVYFANPCGSETVVRRMRHPDGRLGMIATPKQGNDLVDGTLIAADNGCYGKGWPGYDAWWTWLQGIAREAGDRVAFATAPDVVGNHEKTLARSRPWLEKIRDLGLPVAFVAQNGMEWSTWDPWDEIDCLFIGGDTAWKLGPEARELAAVAASLGKWVHVGRVNSAKRLALAVDYLSADSADGTCLTYGPDLNLPKVISWLDQALGDGEVQLRLDLPFT